MGNRTKHNIKTVTNTEHSHNDRRIYGTIKHASIFRIHNCRAFHALSTAILGTCEQAPFDRR
jgi:hypothetical protein